MNNKNLVNRINKKIPDRWRVNPFTVDICATFLGPLVHSDPAFDSELIQAVDHCFETEGTDRRTIKREMLREYVRSWMTPAEFCKFGLLRKSQDERRSYLPEHEALAFFQRKGINFLPKDKFKRYEVFSSHFHREILHVYESEDKTELAKYREFISRNPEFIAKRIKGTKGKGVIKCTAQEAPDANALLALIGGDCIVEEVIKQGQELAIFHPESVNTVRFTTAMNPSKELFRLFALLRVGRGDSIVDNVGSGGIVSLIDMDTGMVCTDGLCGMEFYEEQPDTHIRFKGSKLPDWEELCSIACEMHREQPQQRLYGFDFAWTEKGWDLVETNPVPSFVSFQKLSQKGIRPLLEEKEIM